VSSPIGCANRRETKASAVPPRESRHLHAALVVAFAGALVASGCGLRSCGCDKKVGKESEAPVVPPGSDVEVFSTGSKPQVTLRIARWPGLKYRVTTTADGSSGVEGQPPAHGPTVTMTLLFDVVHGSADPIVRHADGSIQRLIEEHAVLESLSVREAQAPPQLVADYNRLLTVFRGTTMRQFLAETGQVVDIESELLAGFKPPPEVKKAMDGSLDAQRDFPFRLPPILPPIPVGVGASWRFRQTIVVNGAHVIQIADMSLRALDDRSATVHFTLRMEARRQSVPHPFEPGRTATLDAFRGSGDGEAVIDPLTGIAVRGRLSTNTHFALSGDVAGKPARVNVFGATLFRKAGKGQRLRRNAVHVDGGNHRREL
jgi:hypothetical protein